jgi:hypothetical protein
VDKKETRRTMVVDMVEKVPATFAIIHPSISTTPIYTLGPRNIRKSGFMAEMLVQVADQE